MQSVLATGGSFQKRKEYIERRLDQLSISKFDRIRLQAENSVKIEQIRYLTSQLHKKPLQKGGGKSLALNKTPPLRAGIILEAEKTTTEAQNALLKLLEEPPETACLFLSAPNPQHLLPTVVSRCRIIRMRHDPPLLDRQTAKQIQTLFRPEKGDALQTVFELAEKLGKNRNSAEQFIQDALLYVRQQYLEEARKKVAAHEGKSDSLKNLAAIARKFLLSRRLISANVNPRQVLENLFLDFQAHLSSLI